MYKQLSEMIDHFVSNESNCCSKGCSHCCYQPIELLDIEVKDVKNAIKSLDHKTKGVIKSNLKEYWSFFDKHTPSNEILNADDIFTYFRWLPAGEKTKCPLLIDNKCSIYNQRPLTCRIHIVEDKPESCNINPHRDSKPTASHLRNEVIEFVRSKQGSIELRLLSYLVSQVIDPTKELKPISKIII